MKKIWLTLTLVLLLASQTVFAGSIPMKGPVYTGMTIADLCGYNERGVYNRVLGTFSTQKGIDNTKTRKFLRVTYESGNMYVYVYEDTAGNVYIPLDDGYSNHNMIMRTGTCSLGN